MTPYALQRNPTTRKLSRNKTSRKLLRAKTSTSHCCTCTADCPKVACRYCPGNQIPGTITATVVDVQMPLGKLFYPQSTVQNPIGDMAAGGPVSQFLPPTYICALNNGSPLSLNGTFCLSQENTLWYPQPDPPIGGVQADTPFYADPWLTGGEKPSQASGFAPVPGDFTIPVATHCEPNLVCTPNSYNTNGAAFIEIDYNTSAGWVVTIWGLLTDYEWAYYLSGGAEVFDPTCAHGGDAFVIYRNVPFVLFQGSIGDPTCAPNGLTINNTLPTITTEAGPAPSMEPLWSGNTMENWIQLGYGGSVVLNACCAGETYS